MDPLRRMSLKAYQPTSYQDEIQSLSDTLNQILKLQKTSKPISIPKKGQLYSILEDEEDEGIFGEAVSMDLEVLQQDISILKGNIKESLRTSHDDEIKEGFIVLMKHLDSIHEDLQDLSGLSLMTKEKVIEKAKSFLVDCEKSYIRGLQILHKH